MNLWKYNTKMDPIHLQNNIEHDDIMCQNVINGCVHLNATVKVLKILGTRHANLKSVTASTEMGLRCIIMWNLFKHRWFWRQLQNI